MAGEKNGKEMSHDPQSKLILREWSILQFLFDQYEKLFYSDLLCYIIISSQFALNFQVGLVTSVLVCLTLFSLSFSIWQALEHSLQYFNDRLKNH